MWLTSKIFIESLTFYLDRWVLSVLSSLCLWLFKTNTKAHPIGIITSSESKRHCLPNLTFKQWEIRHIARTTPVCYVITSVSNYWPAIAVSLVSELDQCCMYYKPFNHFLIQWEKMFCSLEACYYRRDLHLEPSWRDTNLCIPWSLTALPREVCLWTWTTWMTSQGEGTWTLQLP